MNHFICKISSPLTKYSFHQHKNWEIVYQMEGEAITQVGNKHFTLTKGEIMLIPPNTPHEGHSTTPFRDLSVHSDQIEFNRFAILRDYRGEVGSLLSTLTRICTEQSGSYQIVASSLLAAVCELIKHDLGDFSGFPAVEQIKKEIYDNLSNPTFDLKSAISDTGFDKDYFRRLFKNETGKTPLQYMTNLRIVQAKQLLADKKMFSITAIAETCGFADNLYFSTCFKKHVGCSPIEYRKQIFENKK